MSQGKEPSAKDWANGLGAVAGIICAFAGYAQGGWVGAVFAAVGLAIRLAVGGIILLVILAVLANRAEWIFGPFQ